MPCLLKSDFLLKAVQGSCLQKGETSSFVSVATDSRQTVKNKAFFALKGKTFDGHDFLNQALNQGAKGFVVSNKQKAQVLLKNKSSNVVYVPDTLKALQNLAQSWAKEMNTKVMAITGSNGKTTSKTFTQTLLSSLSPFASPKSYNNPIGVPLSLLSVNRREALLIQELGTNKPGEIAFLTSLCNPVFSAVTMIGPSHLEGLGSTELIAKEKKQIYLQSPKALWLFNRDNPYTEKMFQELASAHTSVLTFSCQKKDMDVCLHFIQESAQSALIEGRIGTVQSKARLLFSGKHNLENLMCACGLALGAGVEPKKIWSLIPKCKPPAGRQKWFQIKEKNISILFDAYNANPSSMNFFLESCKKFSKAKHRLFVLGDMKELGKDSLKYHKQMALHPAILEARFVAFTGEHKDLVKEHLKQNGFNGRFIGSKTYDKKILLALKDELKPEDFVAVKASRSLKLEKLFFDLTGKKIF